VRAPLALIALIALVVAGGASGCGDRLVSGDYLGDTTLRLRGYLPALAVAPERPRVGVIGLGYDALVRRTVAGTDVSAFPIVSAPPPDFGFDILGRPPDVGNYLDEDRTIIVAPMRLARLILVADLDGDGQFSLDENGDVAAPDRLIAEAERHLFLYLAEPPDPAERSPLLESWSAARLGGNLIERDLSVRAPAIRAHVVADNTPVELDAPTPPVTQ
jgi:hypothetical protein